MRIRMANDTDEAGNRLLLDLDTQDEDSWTASFSDGGMLLRFRLDGDEILELAEELERSGFLTYYYEMKAARATMAKVTGPAADDDSAGYALDDPKHPTFHERMVGDL